MNISFSIRLITSLFIAIFFFATDVSASELEQRKEKLIVKIKEDINNLQHRLDHFDPTVKDHVSPKKRKDFLHREKETLENFLSKVMNTPPEQLPVLLASELLAGKYDYMNKYRSTYLSTMGEAMIPELTKRYDHASSNLIRDKSDNLSRYIQTTILETLGKIASKSGLPIVRTGLNDPGWGVASAAVRSLRLILGPESIGELHALLEKPDKEDNRTSAVLTELKALNDPQLCELCLKMNKLSILGAEAKDIDSCSEDLIGQHIDELIITLHHHYYGKGFLNNEWEPAVKLISKLHKKKYLKELYPLFPSVLQNHFHIGSSRNATYLPEWNLVDRIKESFNAEDVQEWLNKNPADRYPKIFAPHEILWNQNADADRFTKIYLEYLLAQKEGRKYDFGGKPFRFEIELSKPPERGHYSRDRICHAVADFSLDTETTVDCEDMHGWQYIKKRLITTLHLDTDTWRFNFDPIRIESQATGFMVEIPFLGSSVTELGYDSMVLKMQHSLPKDVIDPKTAASIKEKVTDFSSVYEPQRQSAYSFVYHLVHDSSKYSRAALASEMLEPLIFAVKNESDSKDWRMAAETLWWFKDPGTLDLIISLLKDNSVRSSAIEFLRQIKDPESVEPLIKQLAHPDYQYYISAERSNYYDEREFQKEVIRTLGEIGDVRAAEPLFILHKKNQDFCYYGPELEALTKIKDIQTVRLVLGEIDTIKEEDGIVKKLLMRPELELTKSDQEMALALLKRIGALDQNGRLDREAKIFETFQPRKEIRGERVYYVIGQNQKDKYFLWFRVLGNLGEIAKQPLFNFLNNDDITIRQAAVYGLATMNYREPRDSGITEILLKYLRNNGLAEFTEGEKVVILGAIGKDKAKEFLPEKEKTKL